jgi:hypothetical protein
LCLISETAARIEMVKHAILYPVLALAQEAQAVADGLGERQRVGAEEQGAAVGYVPD